MNLKNLADEELLSRTKELVHQERQVLTEVLHHLREVGRRKLFSDLKCRSLMDYCIKVLCYSKSQAYRRIQAMQLLNELPELESKIAAGKLNLSNITQAQNCFRLASKNQQALRPFEKLEVLQKLEDKSAREGQSILNELHPEFISNQLNQKQGEFLVSDELRAKLEEVRSLLGGAGSNMDLGELIFQMANLSIESLKIKKFGKKRAQLETKSPLSTEKATTLKKHRSTLHSKNSRHISKEIQHQVWRRDQGKCTNCGSKRNLNFDHIKPFAMNGEASVENLRLLCFHCNHRNSIRTFGIDKRPNVLN